jgi:hypothetical protein
MMRRQSSRWCDCADHLPAMTEQPASLRRRGGEPVAMIAPAPATRSDRTAKPSPPGSMAASAHPASLGTGEARGRVSRRGAGGQEPRSGGMRRTSISSRPSASSSTMIRRAQPRLRACSSARCRHRVRRPGVQGTPSPSCRRGPHPQISHRCGRDSVGYRHRITAPKSRRAPPVGALVVTSLMMRPPVVPGSG